MRFSQVKMSNTRTELEFLMGLGLGIFRCGRTEESGLRSKLERRVRCLEGYIDSGDQKEWGGVDKMYCMEKAREYLMLAMVDLNELMEVE